MTGEEELPERMAYFPGCMISTQEYGYEMSLRELFPKFGVELVDTEGFSCCGTPIRHLNLNVSLYLGLRNIAVAEAEGLDVFAPCPMCHLSLVEAKNTVDKNPELLNQMNQTLLGEELEYKGTARILHTLDVLASKMDVIKEQTEKPVGKLVAAHYGCHTIRYSDLERPDHPESPHKIEDVLDAVGCLTKGYAERLNCCGGPWLANQVDSALTKTGEKLKAISEQGFDGVCHVCPWGHRMMDNRQQDAATTVAAQFEVPVFYLTQLVGYALGLEPEKLGLMLNSSPVEKIVEGLVEPTPEGSGEDQVESTPDDSAMTPAHEASSPQEDTDDTEDSSNSTEGGDA